MAEGRRNGAASISVDGLGFSYGKREVLKDVSFSVRAGEFVGILGPNGSGKTTLLNCVSGALRFVNGRVGVCGKDVLTIGSLELARLVAVVPQESAMNFEFTVEEVVLMGRYSHINRYRFEDERDYAVAERAMRATGIWRMRDRLVTNLSGGERQRVVIARALAQEPRVLPLDEPTTHLDLRHQLEVLGLIRELNQTRGLTVLAVFHDLNLAARFSDRLLLMDGGAVMVEGTPEEVLTDRNVLRTFQVDAKIGRSDKGRVIVEVGDVVTRRGPP